MDEQKKKLMLSSTQLAKDIINDAKTQKDYGTQTMFEKLFASIYKKMPLNELESHRKLINKIIEERKVTQRIIESKKVKK
jgi:hypothetical protein